MPQITASTARLRARPSSADGACATAAPVRPNSANAAISAGFIALPSRLLRKHRLPVLLHVDDGPTLRLRLVPGLVERTDRRLRVIGVFAHLVGVMHDAGEACASSCRRPLPHLPIAV